MAVKHGTHTSIVGGNTDTRIVGLHEVQRGLCAPALMTTGHGLGLGLGLSQFVLFRFY